MIDTFMRTKPIDILLTIHNSKEKMYNTLIAKEVDCFWGHSCTILKRMEDAGLIRSQKNGRIKYVSLTVKGHKLASHIKEAMELLKDGENNGERNQASEEDSREHDKRLCESGIPFERWFDSGSQQD